MTHPYTDLKEAAMKATPGPWHFYSGTRSVWSRGVEPEKSICVITGPYRVNQIPASRLSIGEFIALANPARILSLIEENERMREALEWIIENSTSPLTVGRARYAINSAERDARAALKEKS